MSGTSWLDWDPEAAIRRTRSLEDRASLAFKLVAALNIPGIVLAPWGTPPSWLLAATSFGSTVVLTILYVVEARALDRRRRWALLAARPLLLVVAVFGAYSTYVAFQAHWLKVPFDVVLATWAWISLPELEPPGGLVAHTADASQARAGLRSVSIVLVVTLLQATIWYGAPIFGWGGLLDAHQADLTGSLRVDCGPGGGPPGTLTVGYDWSWRTRAPVPSGLDVVVIGWKGVDGQGRALYLLGATPVTGTGIQPSFQDFPSLDMARELEIQSSASWHWGIHLDRQGMAPGHIEFRLELAHQDPPQPGPITITASYVHLGLWHDDATPVTCTW